MVAHWNLKPARLPVPPYPHICKATDSQWLVVRETGLETVRCIHTPLKRARLPVPPLSHSRQSGKPSSISLRRVLLYTILSEMSIPFLKKIKYFFNFFQGRQFGKECIENQLFSCLDWRLFSDSRNSFCSFFVFARIFT